jgi:hypothetical protein
VGELQLVLFVHYGLPRVLDQPPKVSESLANLKGGANDAADTAPSVGWAPHR